MELKEGLCGILLALRTGDLAFAGTHQLHGQLLLLAGEDKPKQILLCAFRLHTHLGRSDLISQQAQRQIEDRLSQQIVLAADSTDNKTAFSNCV